MVLHRGAIRRTHLDNDDHCDNIMYAVSVNSGRTRDSHEKLNLKNYKLEPVN